MASPKRPATETTSTLSESAGLRLDAVGHEQSLDRTGIQSLNGRIGQQAMAHGGIDRRRAPLRSTTRAASTRVPAEMVKSSTIRRRAALHGADEIDDLGRLGVVHPSLVRDGQRGVQPVGPLAGLLGEPGIGGNDDNVRQARAAMASHRTGRA